MSSHTYHPPTLEAGLHDGCPACEEKADDPLARLDGEHLDQLWSIMLAVERQFPPSTSSDSGRYRSIAEAEVCRRLYDYSIFLERIGIDPRYVWPGPGRSGGAPLARQCARCATWSASIPACAACGAPLVPA